MDLPILSAPHSTETPVLVFGKFQDDDGLSLSFVFKADGLADLDFLDISKINASSSEPAIPQLLPQSEFNDLAHKLGLSKISVELLFSRLNEKHFLHAITKITYYRKKEKEACQ